MTDAPSPWEFVRDQLSGLSSKIDRLVEQGVTRAEYDRRNAFVDAALESIRNDARDQKKAIDASKKDETDERNKHRMWLAGLILSPLATFGVGLLGRFLP